MQIDLQSLRTTALSVAQLNALSTPALVKLRRALIEHSRYLRAGVTDRLALVLTQPVAARSPSDDPPARVVAPRARGGTRRTLHVLRAAVKMLAANRRLVNRVLAARAAEERRRREAAAAERAARRLEAPKQQRRMHAERVLRRRAEIMARVRRERSVRRQYSMCLVLAQRERARAVHCFDRVLHERLLALAEELRPRVKGARGGWAELPPTYASAPDLVSLAGGGAA